MKIHYGVLSQGQGHINRAAEVVRSLRARGHDVRVSLSGHRPPAYAERVLGPFTFERFENFVLDDGKLAVGATVKLAARTFPGRIRSARALSKRLVRERVDLVISDLEPLSAWAAKMARVPTAAIAGQYRITRTDAEGPDAPTQRALARLTIETLTPAMDRYFAVSFSAANATRTRTTVLPPIVEPSLRERAVSRGGFFLGYFYTYALERVLAAIPSGVDARIYGLDRDERHGRVTLCRTDREAFVRDLAACEGVLLNGSFQGVCEASVLQKPVLSIPFAGQYEEQFNAALVARSGLGQSAPSLDRAAIERFVAYAERFVPLAVSDRDGASVALDALSL